MIDCFSKCVYQCVSDRLRSSLADYTSFNLEKLHPLKGGEREEERRRRRRRRRGLCVTDYFTSHQEVQCKGS